MGNVADNLAKASAAAASVSELLKQSGVHSIYLFNRRAVGTDGPGASWDFMIDLTRPITPREQSVIVSSLQTAIRDQDNPAAKIYTTSPQYDRPSFTAWAQKSARLIFPVS
jgi:hypothetical protein